MISAESLNSSCPSDPKANIKSNTTAKELLRMLILSSVIWEKTFNINLLKDLNASATNTGNSNSIKTGNVFGLVINTKNTMPATLSIVITMSFL